MRHIVLCCVVLFGFVGSAEEADAGGLPIVVFGTHDFLAPIQEVDTSQGRIKLAYRYEMTAFILPLWLSDQGYVLVEEDGYYTPLGDSLNLELQSILGTDRPAVPMSWTKVLAHLVGYLGWFALAGMVWRYTIPEQHEPGRRGVARR